MQIALQGHFGYRRLIFSSLPAILMILVGSIYSVVDGLFVSNLVGTTAFAALNVIWPAVMLIGSIGLMVGTGGSALVSQILGQGDPKRANRVFSLLIAFTLGLSLLFALPLFLLMEPLARLLGAEGEMVRQCVVFLLPRLLGPDGIWLAVDAADLCCLVMSVFLLLRFRRRYGY